MGTAGLHDARDRGHERETEALTALLRGRRITVLTGAGCSTESGIPDYRGPETRRRARNPIEYRAFLHDEHARRRYWARALVGWPRFSRAQPNPAHRALARMEEAAVVVGVITQNVDGLHQAAGSRRVVELHGTLGEVGCIACGAVEKRSDLQRRLLALNPGFAARPASPAPDGDADLADASLAGFRVPPCRPCGGALKPAVVFFGETVPRSVVDEAYGLLDEGDALLVVGSSLAVFSGYRFVRRAAERDVPVALVNLGSSRGDLHATTRVTGAAGRVLPKLAAALLPER